MTIDDSMTLVTMVRSDGSMAPFWLGPREPPDYPQPLEYPCNCTRCRNVTDDRETYHDGEVTWWRCIFCARHFELEDTEAVLADECPYVAEDSQACVRCAEGWKQCCARESVPSDAVENNEQPAPPGALSVA